MWMIEVSFPQMGSSASMCKKLKLRPLSLNNGKNFPTFERKMSHLLKLAHNCSMVNIFIQRRGEVDQVEKCSERKQ